MHKRSVSDLREQLKRASFGSLVPDVAERAVPPQADEDVKASSATNGKPENDVECDESSPLEHSPQADSASSYSESRMDPHFARPAPAFVSALQESTRQRLEQDPKPLPTPQSIMRARRERQERHERLAQQAILRKPFAGAQWPLRTEPHAQPKYLLKTWSPCRDLQYQMACLRQVPNQ